MSHRRAKQIRKLAKERYGEGWKAPYKYAKREATKRKKQG